jgi:WD40 repeat protein
MCRLSGFFVLVGILSGADAHLYIQSGHSSSINSAAFSPEGRLLLTGSSDRTARLWDAASGMELRRFFGHTGRVNSVAFSPDGRFVVTASGDHTARLWDPATGAELKRFAGHTEAVNAVAFSPDGRFVATASGDHTARLWSVATGAELRRFVGHTQSISSVAFSPDGRFVLTGGGNSAAYYDPSRPPDYAAHLWNAATGAEVRRFVGHSEWIQSVAFSSDGQYILTGSFDQTARLWDAHTGAELRRFHGARASDYVASVAFSPNSRSILTSHLDGARLWDVRTGAELRHFSGFDVGANVVAFSPTGRSVLIGMWNYSVLFDAASGQVLHRFASHAAAVSAVALSPDGHFLVMGQNRMAPVWDMATGVEVRRLKPRLDVDFTSLTYSPDGRFLLAGGGPGTATLLNPSTETYAQGFVGRGLRTRVAFSPDGRFVLTTSNEEPATLWDAGTGTEIRRFGALPKVSDRPLSSCVAFSPDGRFVLTGSDGGPARLWDVATGSEIRRFETGAPSAADGDFETGSAPPVAVLAVALSVDGRYVLTGGVDRTTRPWEFGAVRLWDAATGAEVRRFVGHSGLIESVAFSPDGHFILTGSDDQTARLWDVATGRELHRFIGHSDSITSVAFSSNGRFAITASGDATSRVWDPSNGRELASLISFSDQGWAVVDPDGRFDTSDLDGGAPLAWIVDNEPMHALPLEIFMRDYYTPRLLPRILGGEKLPPLPSIGSIRNRIQPEVEIVRVEPSPSQTNRVNVSVRAASKTEKNQPSGLQDLRLFRNGQMVGYREGPLKDGTYAFTNIQLPLSEKKVVFTTYAFNSERIKSSTVQRDFEYTPKWKPRPKAYLVEIGVNHYQASGCELRYAVNDAHKLHTALESRLKARGLDVEAIELISTSDNMTATRTRIREALADIASKATPDEVFFLSFSGHGYTAPNGQFYLLPADVEGTCGKPDAELLKNAISADDLTEWLRPIDVGELTFILDACYSAASVEANDFKPGPMGSRGLGQLAYDKRMRILAASQSDEQAQEDSRFGQGLLSYALTEEGLVQGKADWKPRDKQIMIGEWLSYAADAVPKLSSSKNTNEAGRAFIVDVIRRAQIPAVFDFSKQDQFVIQK